MEKKIPVSQPPKLSVTPVAENLLNKALEKVNQGFLGGKVSKMDLASWAIDYALQDLNDAKIEKVRKQFFSQLTYLEAVVKLSRQNGRDGIHPEHLGALQQLFSHRTEKAKTKAGKDMETGELSQEKVVG